MNQITVTWEQPTENFTSVNGTRKLASGARAGCVNLSKRDHAGRFFRDKTDPTSPLGLPARVQHDQHGEPHILITRRHR